MATIQQARGQGRKLSAKQAALVEKLRSMLTPYKALVVSGGVSLGSYQAGFLYYTTFILRRFDEELRHRGWDGPDVGRFRVVTGASAGSINGFLSSIAGCRALGDVPEQSPFYNAWIEVGLRELREKPSVYDALFDHGGARSPGERHAGVADERERLDPAAVRRHLRRDRDPPRRAADRHQRSRTP